MREIRPYGSEGGGVAALPTPIIKALQLEAKSNKLGQTIFSQLQGPGVRGILTP